MHMSKPLSKEADVGQFDSFLTNQAAELIHTTPLTIYHSWRLKHVKTLTEIETIHYWCTPPIHANHFQPSFYLIISHSFLLVIDEYQNCFFLTSLDFSMFFLSPFFVASHILLPSHLWGQPVVLFVHWWHWIVAYLDCVSCVECQCHVPCLLSMF